MQLRPRRGRGCGRPGCAGAVGERREDEVRSLAAFVGGEAEAAVAEQMDAAAVERPEVQRRLRAGADAEHDVTAVLLEQVQRGRGEVAAERIDDDRRPDVCGGGGESIGVGDQRLDGADLTDRVGLGGVAGWPHTRAPRPTARLTTGSPTPPLAPRTSTRSSAVMSATLTTTP